MRDKGEVKASDEGEGPDSTWNSDGDGGGGSVLQYTRKTNWFFSFYRDRAVDRRVLSLIPPSGLFSNVARPLVVRADDGKISFSFGEEEGGSKKKFLSATYLWFAFAERRTDESNRPS